MIGQFDGASDGTTIWDASDSVSYHNDIVVIGRDDVVGLFQKQAKNSDDSVLVFVGALTANNASNTGTISRDTSYLVLGNNGGILQGVTSETPAGIYSRIDREWKITNTNFEDNFSIEFEWDSTGDFDIDDIRLLVDDDGDFSNATVYSTADGLTFTEGSVIIGGISTTHIPVGSTKFVTWGSVTSLSPLPIELLEFEAVYLTDKVDLVWTTATELNNDYFTIEKSRDGHHFEEVAQVHGSGTVNEITEYITVDHDPWVGLTFYRLKQTDYDGKFTYSDVVRVDSHHKSDIWIHPNPTSDQITVEGKLSEIEDLRIFDTHGLDVTPEFHYGEDGSTIIIDLSFLDTGLYYLKTSTTTTKVFKR